MRSVANFTKQSSRLLLPQAVKQATCFSTSSSCGYSNESNDKAAAAAKPKPFSDRVVEFQNKLRAKTPLGKLEEFSRHPFQESEPLKPWPQGVNPNTGEIGGPAGPEPTRYGDWERKGRVSDF